MKRLDQSLNWKEFKKQITGKIEEKINISLLTVSKSGQIILKQNLNKD